MTPRHVIDVIGSDFGVFPAIARLNPMLTESSPLLKLTVRVHWSPDDPASELRDLERQLAAAAPSLGNHQCRGPHQYRLFQEDQGASSSRDGGIEQEDAVELEPGLALAHLYEHVIIDAVAYVTEAPRVSGLTGERAGGDTEITFDVFVECPDRVVADGAAHLARAWVELLLAGGHLDGGPRRALELARRLYRHRSVTLDAGAAARDLHQPLPEVEATLISLVRAGFALEEHAAFNLSGARRFRWASGSRN